MPNHSRRLMLAEMDEQLTAHLKMVSTLLAIVTEQEFIFERKFAGPVAGLNSAKRVVLQKMQAYAKSADTLYKRWVKTRRNVRRSERRQLEQKISAITRTVEAILQKEKTNMARLEQARYKNRVFVDKVMMSF